MSLLREKDVVITRKDVVLTRKICRFNEKRSRYYEKICRFNEKRSRYYEKICRFKEKRSRYNEKRSRYYDIIEWKNIIWMAVLRHRSPLCNCASKMSVNAHGLILSYRLKK